MLPITDGIVSRLTPDLRLVDNYARIRRLLKGHVWLRLRRLVTLFCFWAPCTKYILIFLLTCQWPEHNDSNSSAALILIYKARNSMTPNYIQDFMCAGHINCFNSCCSPLCGPWRPRRASHQTTSRQPSILRRWSRGVEQFAARHSYCINIVYFQKPA